MEKKWIFIIAFTLIILSYCGYIADKTHDQTITPLRSTSNEPPSTRLEKTVGWIVAAGKVEPLSEKINLSFELSGIIDTVLVDEGDDVAIDQILATMKSGERRARLEAKKSQLEAQKAVHDKLMIGAREEEKAEARAKLQQAKIEMKNNLVEAERRKKLLKQQLIAKEEVDRSIKTFQISQKQFEEARQRYLITLTQSREEDIRKAFSELQAAQAEVEEMTHELEKTNMRSPINGTVLRRHKQSGERVSIFLPDSVLTIGDISKLNVRAEVLEKDIAHMKVGKLAYIQTDAFPTSNFKGKIVSIAPQMGEKALYSEKPEELLDTKVLEVVIELEASDKLVPELLVDVFIQANNSTIQNN